MKENITADCAMCGLAAAIEKLRVFEAGYRDDGDTNRAELLAEVIFEIGRGHDFIAGLLDGDYDFEE